MTFPLRFSWLSLTLAACGVASGCAPSTGVTAAPDGVGFCCAPQEPSCECRSTGGHADTADQCASIGRVCDAHPDLWESATDAHGCRFYRVAMWTPGTSSCNPARPDVGTVARPDAAFDAAFDDAPIADAPWPDTNLDAGMLPENVTLAPDGMGFCCVPSTPGCGCGSFGGHAETVSGCDAVPRICDVHPDDWAPVTDEHGCNFYSPPPPFPPGRSCFPDARVLPVDAGPG